MNISPIRAYGAQAFTSNDKRQYGRHDSGYVFPLDHTQTAKTKRTKSKAKATKPNDSKPNEPKIIKTTIHWMDYGDGHRIPIAVEED